MAMNIRIGGDFRPFNIRVPLAQIVTKLDWLKTAPSKAPLPKPVLDLEAQLRASLQARGIGAAGAAAEANVPPNNARAGRLLPTEAGFAELCARLEAALDSITALQPPPPLDTTIAAVLSPSQLRTWTDCQAKWRYKYIIGLPDKMNSKLALGRAFHAATGENLRQKIETKRDLPTAGVVALFRDAWATETVDVEFRPNEDRTDLGLMGEAMLGKYMNESAPLINPKAVELEVEGEIAGVNVRGRVDCLEEDGTISDVKTSSKRPSGVAADHAMQLTIYTQITPGASGVARLETITKTKTIQLVRQTYVVTGQDVAAATAQLPIAVDGMRSGLYMPNRLSMMCSRCNCPYWSACEDEFGGRIKD